MTDRPSQAIRSIRGPTEDVPLYRQLDTDAIAEFHAARILLLLLTCGRGSPAQISGRTKLAKLDFFLRYPTFLSRAIETTAAAEAGPDFPSSTEPEAPMIRYRYGPWDHRYRSFLALLEAKGLVRVTGTRIDQVQLAPAGRRVARQLAERPEYNDLVRRGEVLGRAFGSWSGTALKDLIYELFPTEIGERAMGERIEP